MGQDNEFMDSDSRRAGAPDYIAARRERGKLAQRAFRQRQIDTIRSLEEENGKLRRAISAISDAADRNDAALSQVITEARKVAGIATPEAKHSSNWLSITPIEATPIPAPAPSEESSNLIDFSLPSFEISDQANNSWSQFLSMTSSDAYDLTANIDNFDGGLGLSTSNPYYLGEQIVSAGVSTTFEPDRAIHIADPPPDIVPYMGDKAYTLAGQIYWAALAFGFQALRAIISSATPPPVAVDIVTQQWSFTSKRLALPQIMRLMYARLTFRRYGYFHLAGEKNAEEIKSFLDPNLVKRLSVALGDEANKAGFSKDDFLSPLEFERELRDRFRDDYPTFEAALRGQALDREHVACMRKLIQLMSRQAICFGDGPRWRPESVDTLVDGWTMSTRAFAVH
ncbi:hypothetical protein F4814DRAFT_420469 [Daldinia grandis]|nr:hypothetical protein F4814DRAFT_420469 [Daldinia grandis]